jgi:hypothetical protein
MSSLPAVVIGCVPLGCPEALVPHSQRPVSRITACAGPAFPRECVTAPGTGPWWRLVRGKPPPHYRYSEFP